MYHDLEPTQALAPAIIAAIISGVSMIANGIRQRRENKKTNQANLELAKYQNQADQAAIDKQNAYNTPANQMARFSAGGLNPNLIYGQGNSGNQVSAAKFDSPALDYHTGNLDVNSVLGEYQDFQQKRATTDNIEAQTAKTHQETVNAGVENAIMQIMAKKHGIELEALPQLTQYNLDIKHGEAQSAFPKLQQVMENLRHTQSINPALEKGMEFRNENMRMQNIFQRYREQFEKMGIQQGDHIGIRILVRKLAQLGISLDDF